MFNHTLKNLCSFFTAGKKDMVTSKHSSGIGVQESNIKSDQQEAARQYRHDINNLQGIVTRPEAMQHDWWIN